MAHYTSLFAKLYLIFHNLKANHYLIIICILYFTNAKFLCTVRMFVTLLRKTCRMDWTEIWHSDKLHPGIHRLIIHRLLFIPKKYMVPTGFVKNRAEPRVIASKNIIVDLRHKLIIAGMIMILKIII